MAMFTKISADAFSSLNLEAGVLLNTFDPASPAAPNDSAIICATKGGIKPSCVPNYEDLGADVDNCPENTKEFKRLKDYTCKLAFTCLNMTPAAFQLALGAATVSGNKVTPDSVLASTDFKDIWWVGDRADGGFVAVCLKNALSTGGLTIQSSKNGKGELSVELTGHYSIAAMDSVPMEFYAASAAT